MLSLLHLLLVLHLEPVLRVVAPLRRLRVRLRRLLRRRLLRRRVGTRVRRRRRPKQGSVEILIVVQFLIDLINILLKTSGGAGGCNGF